MILLGKEFADFIEDKPEIDKQIRAILEEKIAIMQGSFVKATGVIVVSFILGVIFF